jgi:NAD kinase
MQCTLVTPVCPHTLSFRPMLLPSSISIRIVVPFGSRHTAHCRFDGRNTIELKRKVDQFVRNFLSYLLVYFI